MAVVQKVVRDTLAAYGLPATPAQDPTLVRFGPFSSIQLGVNLNVISDQAADMRAVAVAGAGLAADRGLQDLDATGRYWVFTMGWQLRLGVDPTLGAGIMMDTLANLFVRVKISGRFIYRNAQSSSIPGTIPVGAATRQYQDRSLPYFYKTPQIFDGEEAFALSLGTQRNTGGGAAVPIAMDVFGFAIGKSASAERPKTTCSDDELGNIIEQFKSGLAPSLSAAGRF